jgi:heptosyltransferase-2
MPDKLIVRLPNWLGDTVMAVPALRALRAAFPDTPLLAAGPWTSVLAGQGLADVLLTYPRAWSARLRSADLARDFRADIAVLLPNSFESALAARYWGAKRRIGFATGARRWLLTDAPALPSPRGHQIDEYMVLAAVAGAADGAAGAAPVSPEPRLDAPSGDSDERREVRSWLADANVSGAHPLVGLHLGAAYGDAKVWPVDRVIELVRRLSRFHAVPLLLGTTGNVEAADRIVAATGAASLVGRDRSATLPALLAELDVLVAGDTGVAHLAAALGTPTVTLFGPTDPTRSAPRGPGTVVRHPVPCAPCFYRSCPIEHPCMRDITAAEVAECALALVRPRAIR